MKDQCECKKEEDRMRNKILVALLAIFLVSTTTVIAWKVSQSGSEAAPTVITPAAPATDIEDVKTGETTLKYG